MIALLASTTYVGLLEGSLFDSFRNPKHAAGQVDVDSLLLGSRSLRLGEDTYWKWQVEESTTQEGYEVRNPQSIRNALLVLITNDCQAAQHLALMTLIFPDSVSKAESSAPVADTITVPTNTSAQRLPHTPNLFSPFSHDSSLVFTLPFGQVPQFLNAVQELPDPTIEGEEGEQKQWIIRATRGPVSGPRGSVRFWLADAWTSFVDLIKVFIIRVSLQVSFADKHTARRDN